MGDVNLPAILLAATRWAIALAAVLLTGALGAAFVVGSATGDAAAIVRPLALQRILVLALTSAAALVAGLFVLLAVQTFAWFGPDGFRGTESVRVMLFDTRWGANWMAAAMGSGAALLFALVARISPAMAMPGLVLAAAAGALATPLIGHGATNGTVVWLTHAGHLAGAGVWIGGLAATMRATWPVWRDDAASSGALSLLLAAFSPVALLGAALVVLSGLMLSLEHVRPASALWATPYGRTLSLKVGVVVAIAALGFRNWRRFGPGAAHPTPNPGARRRLRRAAGLEIGLALGLVLLLTAWLAGLPVPAPEPGQ